MLKPLLLYSLILLSFLACNKDKETSSPVPLINIQGFDLFDYNGNFVMHKGPPDNDWKFIDSLSSEEMKLFDFETSFSLQNTKPFPITENFHVAPNPFLHNFQCTIHSADSVLLKIIIADSNLNILIKYSIKMKGTRSLAFRPEDVTSVTTGSALRLYFSVSAKDHLNFQVGYGDLKVCDAPDPSYYNSCFY